MKTFMVDDQESVEAVSIQAHKELTLRILESLTNGQKPANINVRLWDGSYWPDEAPKAATIVLNRPSALKEMLQKGSEAGVGEAYIRSAFDIEGDIEAAFELEDILVTQTGGWSKKLKTGFLLRHLSDSTAITRTRSVHLTGQEHSLSRDKDAVRFHYDVSNDFYRLWLDPLMIYSCAYFSNPDNTLEAAQVEKLDHICRKLALRPGERLLDIGCGWGGLLIHAARHYGIVGTGITLSENQRELAQKRIEEAGLQDRITVRIQDYRALEEGESYDAIVSVGMVEHVGRKMLPEYFQRTARLLKPGGLFLNHGIGVGPIPLPTQSGSFIHQYVFPDTDLVPIGLSLAFAEDAHFEVRDVESLREHYALTLRHWVRRLEAKRDEALQYVNDTVYRIWKLYMAGCIRGFKLGKLSVYQTLLAKLTSDGSSRAPLTRSAWYRMESTPPC
ncbi:MAG TPA: cyclopropane-fatty-acyl-phospholipid synthase family protein [Candidatus Methylacidiphilales bacterium]|nr:cyclopropane-fatty-acyl-phospholipid synthase family protein [Candidatus Methylacidiphilales bacterium]